MGVIMAEVAPVTCSSCMLKYLARPDGICPRCNTAQDAPLPAELSNPVRGQRRSLTSLVWIGGAVVVLVGVAAVWSSWKGGRNQECRRVAEIIERKGADVELIQDAWKKRSEGTNGIQTYTDMANEFDRTADELDAVSLKDPLLIAAVDNKAANLRRLAELTREEGVAIRAQDRERMRKLVDKEAGVFDEQRASFDGIANLCGWQRKSDTPTR